MPDCDPIRTRNEGLKTMVDPLREICLRTESRSRVGPSPCSLCATIISPNSLRWSEPAFTLPNRCRFSSPWTVGTPDEVSRRFIQYHWSVRGAMTMTDWKFETAIVVDGEIVGCQAFAATDFPTSRTGETGSWIGRGFQGRGCRHSRPTGNLRIRIRLFGCTKRRVVGIHGQPRLDHGVHQSRVPRRRHSRGVGCRRSHDRASSLHPQPRRFCRTAVSRRSDRRARVQDDARHRLSELPVHRENRESSDNRKTSDNR